MGISRAGISRVAHGWHRCQDMIGKMNVGIRPSEAEELFELFDTDASGGIDDKEFMKALFPDDYRRARSTAQVANPHEKIKDLLVAPI